ncbi:MAG: TIGR02996 domain-containing protein [Gemmataceae bacterium]
MNPYNEQLFQAIRESPLDESLRLVYADWLEENGDAPQAEVIRLQCEIAHLDPETAKYLAWERRIDLLLRKYRKQWFGTPRHLEASYERGTLTVAPSERLMQSNHVREWWSNYGHLVISVNARKIQRTEALKALKELGWLDGVTGLELLYYRWEDENAAEILADIEWLRSLHVDLESLRRGGLERLTSLKHLQHLTVGCFYANGNEYDDYYSDGFETFQPEDLELFGRFQNLRSLTFLDSTLGGAKHLAALSGLSHLRELDVEFDWLIEPKESLEALSKFQSLEKLVLYLFGDKFVGSWIKPLAKLPKLQELHCSGSIGESDATNFFHLFPSLRRLILHTVNAKRLSLMKELSNLEYLRLFVGYDVLDISPLPELPSLPKLRVLNVAQNNVKSKDMPEIAKFPELRSLVLSRTAISGNSLKHLVQLQHLEDLALHQTNVQDVAIKHLAKMSALRYVSLWGTKVSKEARRQLRKERPDLTIL